MDISVMIDNIKFNYRVATIIKNNNKILLHKSKEDNFYAIPGGRIMIDETSENALKREFIEEIGAKITIKNYLGTVENFFEYNGKKYHELMIVYESTFDSNSNFYKEEKIRGLEENGKIEFIWKTIDEIKQLDLRPLFLKENIISNTQMTHLINNAIN
ncbi:MAG: NUDIX hydrolase [Clostridia bacterium]